MNVQTLIYAYLAICGAMIFFNIVCIFVFRRGDKKLEHRSRSFARQVRQQLSRPETDGKHKKYLRRKLCRVSYLMAFDETLEELRKENPERIKAYIHELSSVFIFLTLEYSKKNKLKAAYFPYIINKYGVLQGYDISIISDVLLELAADPSLYCRENAVQAIYSAGDCDSAVAALKTIDAGTYYHNPKLITDDLLAFAGDTHRLGAALWKQLPGFKTETKAAVLNYFRMCSGDYCGEMLSLLTDEAQNDEVRYCCIRYFGKYKYEPAYPLLLAFAENESEENWEYAAISASALSEYPSDETVRVLKEKLYSRNWYVRYNAALSLEKMGLDYTGLADVLEGDDRYAGEMLRYRFDRKRLSESEAPVL